MGHLGRHRQSEIALTLYNFFGSATASWSSRLSLLTYRLRDLCAVNDRRAVDGAKKLYTMTLEASLLELRPRYVSADSH